MNIAEHTRVTELKERIIKLEEKMRELERIIAMNTPPKSETLHLTKRA